MPSPLRWLIQGRSVVPLHRATLSVLVAIFGATFVSFGAWPGQAPARAQAATHVSVDPDVVSSADPLTTPAPVAEYAFSIEAINITETITVHCPAPTFEPDEASFAAAQHLMRAVYPDKEGKIDRRLLVILRDIAQASGSKIQLISAYRRPGWRSDYNYHVRGQAADIRVPQMSTRKLRDLAKSLGIKGVGYYPTSQMIHVDVRDEPWFWTDWSGPSRPR